GGGRGIGLSHRRRVLALAGAGVAALALAWLVAWPRIVRALGFPFLQQEWGDAGAVGGARWGFGRSGVVSHVGARDGEATPRLAAARRVVLRFERVPLFSDPGRLVEAHFVNGEIGWEGQRLAQVAEVVYRCDAHGKTLDIDGLDGDVSVETAP